MKKTKTIKRLQKTNAFRVSKTYDLTTPESAEHGDFSESGFEIEPYYTRSIVEILELIKSSYVYENFQSGQKSQSLYSNSWTEDYSTCEEKQVAVHVDGPEKLMRVLNKQIEKALRGTK